MWLYRYQGRLDRHTLKYFSYYRIVHGHKQIFHGLINNVCSLGIWLSGFFIKRGARGHLFSSYLISVLGSKRAFAIVDVTMILGITFWLFLDWICTSDYNMIFVHGWQWTTRIFKITGPDGISWLVYAQIKQNIMYFIFKYYILIYYKSLNFNNYLENI